MLIIATNWMPRGVQGVCLHPRLVLVRPERKDDAVLLAHEAVHAEQQERAGWWRWVWRYLMNPGWRLHYEVEAYRVSVSLNPAGLHRYANALATLYRLDLTYAQARALLLRESASTPQSQERTAPP